MHRSHRRVAPAIRALCIASTLPALSGYASAETAVDDGGVVLGPLTVTATKTDLDISVLPDSASVLERSDIRTRQPQDLGDLLQDLPNVDIGGGPRGIGQTVTIRGLSDERILFLLDGARQNFARAHSARVFVEPDLLRRVEVLRGPASVLWGSGALGGVVALETVDAADLLKPDQDLGARVKAGYQDVNGQWMGGAAVYGRAGGQFDYLLDLAYRDGGDIRLGDGSDLDNSAYQRLSGLAKGSWSPDGINRFSASYMGLDEDGEVPSNPQTAGSDDSLVDRTTRQDNLTLRYRYDDPDNALLNPSVVLYRNKTDIEEDLVSRPRSDSTELITTGFDLRNTMRFGTGSSVAQVLTYGVEYYKDEVTARRDGAPRESFPDGSQQIFSAYLQDEITLGRRLTLVPGIRWDNYRGEAQRLDADDNEDSAWSIKLGASYKVTDWMALLASYNEAFRAPSISELFISGVHFSCGRGCQNLFVPNPNLKPEKAHNKEIGISLFKDGLLTPGDAGRFRASFFRNDVSDFIDRSVLFTFRPVPGNPGPGGVSTSDNVSDARLEGFEIEALYDAPRWFAGLAYARTRGEDEDTGDPLSSVQPDAWIAQAGLRFPAQGIRLGWRGRFVDAQDRVPPGGEESDSYDVQDIWLSWDPVGSPLAGLGVDVGVDNLFDADYTPYLSALQAPGRNIKVSVSYRF
jgi:hemoglobin/transferrin/lactoferrin receptor protein